MAAAPTPAAEALLGALADRRAASAAELAAAAGIGRSTAAKLLATLAGQGRVLRQPGGHWTLPAAAAATQDPGPPTTAAPASPADQPSRRLRSGQLRDLVLGYLTDRPGQALSPTAIATALDRSAGAVANALTALAGQGAVAQTQAKPRRYTIAPADGGDPATTQR